MRRTWVYGVMVLLLAALAAPLSRGSAQNQPDTDELEATLEALQTEVAVIETQIADAQETDGREGTPTTEDEPASSPLISGPALPDLPDGDPGELAVIVQGAYDSDRQAIVFVLRNNTDEALVRATVTAIARDDGGDLLATGDSISVTPNRIEPDTVAFGYVYLDAALPPTTAFEVSASATSAEDDTFAFLVDVAILNADLIDDRIVGEVRNIGDDPIGLASIAAVCFDADGQPTGHFTGSISGDGIAPGDEGVFQISLFGEPSCDSFLVAGNGLPAS